jgi:hypothetical protein
MWPLTIVSLGAMPASAPDVMIAGNEAASPTPAA